MCIIPAGYFPRYLWGIDLAIILAITAKTTTKTLRSIVYVFGVHQIDYIDPCVVDL